MEHRFFRIIVLALVLAMLAPSVAFAAADAPEELELDIDESAFIEDVEGDLLPTDGDVLELSDGFADGLASGDLLDVAPSGKGTEALDIPHTPEKGPESKGDEDRMASDVDEPTAEGDTAGADAGEQTVYVEIEIDEAVGDDAEATPGEAMDALPGETDDAALALASNDISEPEVVGDSEGTLESVTASGGMDNDAMFEAYMRQVLPGMAPRLRLRAAKSGGANLSGLSAKLYEALLPMIREVAGGMRTSTVFELDSAAMDTENRWWTAEDLGLESLSDKGVVGPALLAKEGFDQTGIMQALLANCPYDLYWFDKTRHENKPFGMGWTYLMTSKTDNGVQYIRLKSMTAKMVVAKDYSRTNEIGTYEVNDLPRRVSDAVTNIKQIVADNSGKSDEDKLWAYANAVCGLVEYNYDAVKPDTPYGDPWQLVFIFDGVDSTNVVCEGYSKGFKYLCDLSSFQGDVACELMSGSILAGAHMWNTVHMPDGRNYLVDLTNSDGGSSCDGWCYMKGCTGDPTGGYTCNGLEYQYGGKMLDTFGIGWLTLSNGDYGKDYAVNVSATCGTLTADPAVADPGNPVTLTLTPDDGCTAVGITVDHGQNLQKTGDYTWTFTMPMCDVNAVATCVQSSIRYTAQGYSGVYDGQPHGIRVDVHGATVAYGKSEGTYTETESPTWEDAGTHTVYFRISDGTDQSVTGQAAVIIKKRTVGLAWDDGSFVYDGNTHSLTATAKGLVGEDTCTVTVEGSGKNAGSYTVTAKGLSNDNYQLPKARYNSFTIKKRPLTLIWDEETIYGYDGEDHVPIATFDENDLIDDDSCAVTVTGSQKDAGSYTATAKLNNANYTPVNGKQTFTITPKTVGLSWGANAFTYDGQGHAPTATATGLVSGDSCAVTVDGKQTNVGSYTARANKLSNGNYALPSANTKAFTIGKRTVGLSWGTSTFTYDGQGHAPTAAATGLVSGDSCTVTVAGKQTNVGNYTATATGLSNANYALTSANTKAFTIGRRTVGLRWGASAFTYDGQGHAPAATATGLVSGDSCAVTVTGEQTDVGNYTAMATGLSNGNYALPSANTRAFTIGRRTVGLRWGTGAFTYDGQGHAPTATATGLVSGDNCAVAVDGKQTNAGSYTATAIGLSNDNYALPEDVTQAFVISPKTVKLKWSKTRVTYNGKPQKPKATAVGLIPGDTCTVTVKGSGKNAGFYTARATGLSNGNYALPSAKSHVMEIRKKTVKLKWTRTRLKYNGKSQKPKATATGLINGDKCKVTVTGAKKKRGTYTAKATKLSNKNYKLPKVTKVKFRIY